MRTSALPTQAIDTTPAHADALRDRRFQPIDASELPNLTCTVSLLHSFEGNKAWDAWEPGRHGIIISFVDPRDGRRKSATFLPEVAREEGWGRRETLEHLVSKAGCAAEGPAFENLLPKISLTRYQSTAASLSYEECIDLDTIETSNLNRQFLFRQQHVGQSKAVVAASVVQKMAPGVRIEAYQANVKEPRFSADFVSRFSLVLNGLDNLEARRHVNRLCLAARVPLVESGTAGFLGQVSVHDLLFARLFGPADAVTDLDDAGADGGREGDGEANEAGVQSDNANAPSSQASKRRDYARLPDEDPLDFAARVFQAFFVKDVRRLAAVEGMWKDRAPPTPSGVDLEAVRARVAAAALPRVGQGVTGSLGLLNAQALWSAEDNAAVLLASIRAFFTVRLDDIGAASFDKDDALAVDFVAAASNLRALSYGIPTQSLFHIKGMAGNIIHAVATTNAIASGLIVIEAFKILAGQLDRCQTTFLLEHPSNNKVLTPMTSPEPNPRCIICGTAQLTLRADLGSTTLETVVKDVLKKRLALLAPTVVAGNFMYEEGDDLEPDEVEFNEANLLKRLKDLPGGGLGAGSALEVSDQAQQLSFRLVLEHEASWDEDVTPERWEIRGDLPAKAAEEGEAGSDDDVIEVAEGALDVAPASEPLEERTLEYSKDKEVECLMDAAKAHFARVRPAKTAAQRAAQLAELRAKLPPGAEGALEGRLMDMATSLNMVESVALLPNMPAHGFVGVNLYVDDEGAIRDAPVNARASEVATLCGKLVQVRGDAFLARVLDNGDDFERRDFTLADLSSTAPWVAAAREKSAAAHGGASAEALFRQLQAGQGTTSSSAGSAAPAKSPAETLKDEGNQAFKRGDFEKAVELYSSALEKDGTLVAARNNRAQALLNLERWPAAEADAAAVLELEPENVKALLRLATASERQGQADRARQTLERALQLQPANKEAAAALNRLESGQSA
ncbi:hypothetical protein QBZ16_000526 [Prototheca wickerhamii]|uniref:AMMECR1 domain-containing protein n=1 Tax=Prototheca wickerhamii TaxID=3111 RepID=A0AAD9MJY9_PROWI|nr:hypothetical protein QBZ16_000526 [Prototheca wickerhamii]